MPSDSLVKMQVSTLHTNAPLNTDKQPLGTILGTINLRVNSSVEAIFDRQHIGCS